MTNLTKGNVDLNSLWDSLGDVLRANLGLHYPPERVTDLKRGILAAASVFGLSNAEDCARWLLSSPMSLEQIEILANCLTVGETYFFRDPTGFEILKEEILLPCLKSRQGVNQQLRIWSAACCTGEEPYSIAMLLTQVIPNINDWMITLLATDLNIKFLQKAEAGMYSQWSFRGVPENITESFFSEGKPEQFSVIPQIKNMVTFAMFNLITGDYHSIVNRNHPMDIIFCRNVLMYFEPKQAYDVIKKLSQTLVEGGWLFLSPCDVPHHIELPQLKILKFGDYTVYQKDSTDYAHENCPAKDRTSKHLDLELLHTTDPFQPPPTYRIKKKQDKVNRAVKHTKKSTQTTPLHQATLLFNQGAYDEALKITKDSLKHNPSSVELMVFLGKIHANLGQLLEARNWCEQALTLDPVHSKGCDLYAMILQEQGLDLDAVSVLRRLLYLDNNNPVVHFSLGNIYRRQNNPQDATRHYQNALNLLKEYASDDDVPGSDGMSVRQLTDLINAVIDVEMKK